MNTCTYPAIRTSRRSFLRSLALFAGVAMLTGVGFWTPAQADQNRSKKEEVKEQPYTGPRKRLAVMNMELPRSERQPGDGLGEASKEYLELVKRFANVNTRSDVGLKLTEMLTTTLSSTGRFVLVERANIQDIRDEINVGEELATKQTAIKKGNVLGAQILVRCAVTEFVDNGSQSGGGVSLGGIISIGGSQKVSRVGIDIKMVDANTSEVLYAETAMGDSKTKEIGGGISIGSFGAVFGKSDKDPIEKATRMAIKKAVDIIISKMEDVPWEGRVATMNGGGNDLKLVINRGQADGLKEGDVLRVYRPGESITDPDTGKMLGRDEDKQIGEARVTWVSKNVARLVPVSGSGFQKGDVVKINAH